jgi:hypothetical protein
MDAIKFVTIWNTSETLDEVLEKTQLTRGAAHARASTYRRKYNIPLKAYSSGRQNWELVAQAAQLALNEAQTEENQD